MKRTIFWTVVFTFTLNAGISFASGSSAKSLRKFTSKQLIACFEDKSICGINSVDAISDELVSRLPQLPDEELFKCLGDWKVCGVGNGSADGWAVSEELARRSNLHTLLMRYWTDPDQVVRYGIVHVAYRFKTPEAREFMKRVFEARKGDDEFLYWPANYLAKQCDPEALEWFSTRTQRSESCMQYATTIELFGKCHYRQAIPYLLEYSTHDVCLNIVDAAADDLHKLYPHSPKGFETLEDFREYYCQRAKQEGLRVDCNFE